MRKALLYNWWLSGGYSFSSQYQAVLDYATTQGYTKPTAAQQVLEDIKMRALVSSGKLARRNVYYNFATNGSLNFACINWCSPGTFQALPSAVLPFFIRKEGVQGDSIQVMYLNSQFNPTANGGSLFTLADNGISLGILNNVDDSGDIDYGCNDSSNADRTSFLGRSGTSTSYFQNNSTSRAVNTGSTSIGRFIAKRISGTISLFKNGSSVDSFSQAATGLPNVPIWILGENNNGSGRNYSGRRLSYWDAGDSLNGIEAASDLVESNYMTSLVNDDPDEIKFLFEGDSITFGTGTTRGLNYPIRTYVNLDRPIQYNNIAVAGWTSAQMLARVNTYGTYLNASGVFVLFTGTNDVLTSVATATTWANIQGIIAAVEALGVTKIAVGTLMDCSTYSGAQQTLRADLNTLIRNNTSLGYSVMDFSANVNLGTYNAPHFDDTVHPNNLGASVMASISSPVIDALI